LEKNIKKSLSLYDIQRLLSRTHKNSMTTKVYTNNITNTTGFLAKGFFLFKPIKRQAADYKKLLHIHIQWKVWIQKTKGSIIISNKMTTPFLKICKRLEQTICTKYTNS
jgi:hypothetical protein